MKKVIPSILLACVTALPVPAFSRDTGYTMIVAPARYSVMQVMFDVIAKRSSVLVSYQQDPHSADPLLHVWNGASWMEIGLHDLREMSFVQRTPTRAILVGDDELLPAAIPDAVGWLPEVQVVRQLDNAALLNDFGRILAWSRPEWAWFSARYNLTLEDEAAAMRQSSWYDQAGPIIRGNQPVYEPVPVVTAGETINPSSTTLPPPEPTSRPVDSVPVTPQDAAPATDDIPEADEAPATSRGVENDLEQIVEALEQSMPADAAAAP